MTQTKAGEPLDLEALSPEEAAKVLKRHNPRLKESTETLAEVIRRVRAGIEPLEEDPEVTLRAWLAEGE